MSTTISEKLTAINMAKQDIKDAIIEKGVDMSGIALAGYADKIREISGEPMNEVAFITLTSNQAQPDTSLNGLEITISYNTSRQTLIWQGETLQVEIPINVEYTVSFASLDNYTVPESVSYTAENRGVRNIIATYQTSRINIILTTDGDIDDFEGQNITVSGATNNTVSIGSGRASFNVILGGQITITPPSVNGYSPVTAQAITASQSTANVSFYYEKVTHDLITIDQSISDPATMVGGDVNGTVIQYIRDNSHRVVAKKTGDGTVTYCRLSDTDSTKFHDGTNASSVITTQGCDVFMKMPTFFYKGENVDENHINIYFSLSKEDSDFIEWDSNTLIGAYEAYVASNKVYSKSGLASTGSVSQANFKTYARNRGTGYQIVDWEMHCIMGCLFFAKYGSTNSQGVCGAGTNSYTKNTGETNSLGMTDTTTSNGNSMSINFWGLENWWGNKFEWIDNLVADNCVWTVTNPDGSTRNVGTSDTSGGYISKLKFGRHLDMLPIQDNGSTSTGYCDYHAPSTTACVVARSCGSAGTGGGVACVYASGGSSDTSGSIGSRLAFRGVSTEAESVTSFCALPTQ